LEPQTMFDIEVGPVSKKSNLEGGHCNHLEGGHCSHLEGGQCSHFAIFIDSIQHYCM